MKMSLARAMLLSLTVLAGCGGDDEEEELPDVDCGEGTIPTYAEVTAFDTCTLCHSSQLTGEDRSEAPTSINFDTYEAAKKYAEDAAAEVHEGAMPPADSAAPALTAEEKDMLYKWALCGTPE